MFCDSVSILILKGEDNSFILFELFLAFFFLVLVTESYLKFKLFYKFGTQLYNLQGKTKINLNLFIK